MKKRMKSFLKVIAIVLVICILAFIIFFTVTLGDNKLDINRLKKTPNSNILANGEKINQNEYVKLNEISKNLSLSFVALEDKRFYEHKGLDYKRILGATVENIKSHAFKEGASTITQQLIKNTHLTNKKSFDRKFKEMKLAK
ncbi:MAG: biosynthetic peptidoglycan transglycosylase, partial [Clostridia bacterium]